MSDLRTLTLDGTWEFCADVTGTGAEPGAQSPTGDATLNWQEVSVPGAWEAYGVPKNFAGPCWYRRSFEVPGDWDGHCVLLEFSAVSYHCDVWVNGHHVGSHTGAWDTFSLDITDYAPLGTSADVVVKVYKPGDGPFPLRQTLAGFLPYVGTMFGGLWQPVKLKAVGAASIEDVHVRPDIKNATAEVTVQLHGRLPERLAGLLAHRDSEAETAPVALRWTLTGPDASQSQGTVDLQAPAVAELTDEVTTEQTFTLSIPDMKLWSLESPHLYQLQVDVVIDGAVADASSTQFGMREVSVSGSQIFLNGELIYPRGILTWGWQPERIAPIVTRDEIKAELTKAKELGYNMIKHCLYIPVPEYFEVADEMGMLTWLELPLWAPRVTDAFREQAMIEYERILRQVRNYPSLIMYTLGCELNQEVDAQFLENLFDLTRQMTGSPLIRDNSGSAECYGGIDVEYADYYDHHFYAEPHRFRAVLDWFSPRERGAKPWVFGEFCDSDTYRDLDEIVAANGGQLPWWMIEDDEINPKGVRWEYTIVDHLRRVEVGGLRPWTRHLIESSRRQATLIRKMIIENVRSYSETSGYVVLNLVDTPICTPGMIDDLGRVKFDPEEFRRFNADSVLTLRFDRRRQWLRGGDRPLPRDVYNYYAQDRIRPRIVLAYVGADPLDAVTIQWRASLGDQLVASGEETIRRKITPGDVTELTVAEFHAPVVSKAAKLTFEVEALVTPGHVLTKNQWTFWVFPQSQLVGQQQLTVDDPDTGEKSTHRVALFDPGFHLRELPQVYPLIEPVTEAELENEDGSAGFSCVISSGWSEALARYVERGGRVLLVQNVEGPLPSQGVPFWRESHKLFWEHPIFDHFPHENMTDTQFYGLATDVALDFEAFEGWLGRPVDVRPVLRRVDGRHLTLLDYITEIRFGKGLILATTLRFQGGHGDQPADLRRHVAGQALLETMIRYLCCEQ